MRHGLAALVAIAASARVAAARPGALYHGHVTAELPAGWRADGVHFVAPDGKTEVEVLMRSEPARLIVPGFRDDGIDGWGRADVHDGKVGGLPGQIVTAGDDTAGAWLGVAETCLGTITIRASWDAHDPPRLRAQLRAIVRSARITLAGADPFDDVHDDEKLLVPDPASRPAADRVVSSICGTAAHGDDATALFAGSVRVQTGDGSVTILAPELAAQVRAAGGLGAFARATVGPWLLVRRPDDTVVVLSATHGTGSIILGAVDGAWRIVAIERPDP